MIPPPWEENHSFRRVRSIEHLWRSHCYRPRLSSATAHNTIKRKTGAFESVGLGCTMARLADHSPAETDRAASLESFLVETAGRCVETERTSAEMMSSEWTRIRSGRGIVFYGKPPEERKHPVFRLFFRFPFTLCFGRIFRLLFFVDENVHRISIRITMWSYGTVFFVRGNSLLIFHTHKIRARPFVHERYHCASHLCSLKKKV